MAGRTGGLLVEAIVRHMLRIAGRAVAAEEHGVAGGGATGRAADSAAGGAEVDDTTAERHGCVCYAWVKAHGGGIAPNAYADAIAKSHLAEEPQDVPLAAMMRRLCVYEVAAEEGDARTWALAADRSLRGLMVERLTAGELQRLRAETRSGGTGTRLATERCDKRLLAAMLQVDARPGALETKRGYVTPTATGMAMRLRTDDLKAGRKVCELCGAECVDGGHVLRCTGSGGHRRKAAEKIAAALRAAAAEATHVEMEVPMTAAWKEWAAGGKVTDGAVAALGRPRDAETVYADAEQWATAGWRSDGEEYELSNMAGSDDLRRIAWCAATVSNAGAWEREQVRAACEQAAGAEAASAEAASRSTALHRAAQAIGAAETSGPDAPKVAQLDARSDEIGVVSVRMKYSQLRRMRDARTGEGVGLDEWGRAEGGWLRRAREQGAVEGEWSAHTRHGFKRGAGAAHRKEMETVAVAPDGAVYAVTQPGSWPWQLQYDILVRCEVEGTVRHDVTVRLRLQRDKGNTVAIGVSAWPADAEGRQAHSEKVPRQHVNAPLEGADLLRAAQELFWVHGWDGAPPPRDGTRGLLLKAAEAAETATQGWESVRRALSGELPQQTMAERVQEREMRDRREEEAKTTAAAAVRAATRAKAARAREESRRGGRSASGAARTRSAEAVAGEALEAAAGVLEVRAGAEIAEVRKNYLRLALQHHPDKGSSDDEHYRTVQEAYETMRGHAPEARRRMEAARREAGGTAAGDGGEGNAEMEGEEELERAEAAEAKALEESAAAAESAARPREWLRVAAPLKEAAAIYFREWHAFQRGVQRKRMETAKAEGYDTHAEKRAAQARQRTEQRQAEREAADAAALEAMRQERERDKAELRERRQQEETRLRELSGRALSEAIAANWLAVAEGYIVRVPWAMWCQVKCTCRGGAQKCIHRNSNAYTNYEITEVLGSGEDMKLRMERAGRTYLERQEGLHGDGTTWNKFTMTWREAAGIERYGKDKQGVRIEPRAAADGTLSDDAESEPDEDEEEMPRVEMRQARRHMRAAMAANREADRTEGAQEETAEAEAAREEEEEGAAQQDGREGGSGDAEEEEEEEGGRSGGEQEEGEREGARRVEREAARRGADGEKRAAVAAGRARAGKNWWKEGWMGPVAASEYAESWGREGMGGRRRSEQYAANMQGAESATRLGREAAR